MLPKIINFLQCKAIDLSISRKFVHCCLEQRKFSNLDIIIIGISIITTVVKVKQFVISNRKLNLIFFTSKMTQ